MKWHQRVGLGMSYAVSPALGWGCYAYACITCSQPDGAAPFHSTTTFHAVSPVRKNCHCMNQELSLYIKGWLFDCGSGVSCMQLHPGGWGRVGWARRSFSLPCFRLAHILRQPSAPIHPLDPILLGLKECKSQHASTYYHQHIAVAQSISEHLVRWFPLSAFQIIWDATTLISHHKLFVQEKKVSEAAKDPKGFWAGWIGCHPLRTQTTFAEIYDSSYYSIRPCRELFTANKTNSILIQNLAGVSILHGMCGRYPFLASQLTCRWCLWSIRVQALWNARPLCTACLCAFFSVHSDVLSICVLMECWTLSTLVNTASLHAGCQNKIGH